MEKSGLIGKRLIIVKSDFNDEQIVFFEKNNECEIIDALDESFIYEFNNFDHLLCDYTFGSENTKELFKKINDNAGVRADFLITPRELERLEEDSKKRPEALDKAQNLINDYLTKYPEFFKKIEPDFFKKRLMNIMVIGCGHTQPTDIAVFSFDEKMVGLVSRSKIEEQTKELVLRVNVIFGQEKEHFDISLKGKFIPVEFDIEDADEVFCYQMKIDKANDAYNEVLEALKLQEDSLASRLSSGGFE